jgi:ribulose kinase
MFAAAVAGLYPGALEAQKAMRAPIERSYSPDRERRAIYDGIYAKYQALGAFAEKEMRR